MIDFAEDVLGWELIPWEEWFLIHALELNPNGTWRFKTILCLVARQNGKTFLLALIALWKMFREQVRFLAGAAQDVDQAHEVWQIVADTIQDNEELAPYMPLGRGLGYYRTSNHKPHIMLKLPKRPKYRYFATNDSAGRGKVTDCLLFDELLKQKDFKSWGSLSKTCNARPNAQKFLFSNAGDRHSVVLNHFRDLGLATAQGEYVDDEDAGTLMIAEWSGPDGCDLMDREAWAQSNPSLGYTITEGTIANDATTDPPNVFRTEVMCQNVDALDGAVDADAWTSCTDRKATMDVVKDRLAMVLDISMTVQHASLSVAGVDDQGKGRLEVIAEWRGKNCVAEARRDLPGWISKVQPVAFGWFPNGPAAAMKTDLNPEATIFKRKGRQIKVHELAGSDVTALCQEFAEQVQARNVIHGGDSLLTGQVQKAQKLYSGDGWKFQRARDDGGNVDAVYASAGALKLARNLPRSLGKPRILTARSAG